MDGNEIAEVFKAIATMLQMWESLSLPKAICSQGKILTAVAVAEWRLE